MHKYRLFLLVCILLCIVSMLNCKSHGARRKHSRRRTARSIERFNSANGNPLLILMVDGMRWDYVPRLQNQMPGFSRFLREGVQAEYVEPPFPSLSYTGWATLSTGLYPENHGIIGNFMVDLDIDPTGNELFKLIDASNLTTKQSHWWQNSEPIWITATRQKKRTFLRKWSRCDVPFKGQLPEECMGFYDEDGVQELNKTLKMGLQKLHDGFDLVMLYGEEIDNKGHQYGPDSDETKTTLLELDAVFMEFLQDLDKYPSLKEKLNIIVVSDHGMTDVRPSKGVTHLKISDYVDERDILKIAHDGPLMNIQPIKSRVNDVYKQLKQMPGVYVYNKADIPEHYHYKNNPLVLDILLIAKVGYFVSGLVSDDKQVPRMEYTTGFHGYTPDFSDMRALFYARGPAFKKNAVCPPIKMVDIYQLYSYCLGIVPQPNNGTWASVAGMLAIKHPQHHHSHH